MSLFIFYKVFIQLRRGGGFNYTTHGNTMDFISSFDYLK